MRRKPAHVSIRYNCVTGQAVWVYQGASPDAERMAYWRASKKEMTRVRWWNRRVAERADAVRSLLDACLSALPDKSVMTDEQAAAVRRLEAVIAREPECDRGFYNHIRAERRRRERIREIRLRMREREKNQESLL